MASHKSQRLSRALLVTCLVFASFSIDGLTKEVYKEVGEDGKVVFTDNPHSEGEPVEVQEPNTVKGVTPRPQRSTPPQHTQATGKFSVEITSPADQQILPNRLLPVTVSATTTPDLPPSHTLRLVLDGEPHSTGRESFVLEGLSLGAHSLQVQILGPGKVVVAESEIVTVYARQPGN